MNRWAFGIFLLPASSLRLMLVPMSIWNCFYEPGAENTGGRVEHFAAQAGGGNSFLAAIPRYSSRVFDSDSGRGFNNLSFEGCACRSEAGSRLASHAS